MLGDWGVQVSMARNWWQVKLYNLSENVSYLRALEMCSVKHDTKPLVVYFTGSVKSAIIQLCYYWLCMAKKCWCGLSSYSESEETINCKWTDAPSDSVQLIECKSYKSQQPSLCFVVCVLLLLLPLPLAYWVLHGDVPHYLGALVRVDDLPGRRPLHSTNINRLMVPPVRLSTVGSRAFAVAAPHIWNRLPTDVVAANSLSTFLWLLKRFLFRQSYPDMIYWLWHHPISGPCSGCAT